MRNMRKALFSLSLAVAGLLWSTSVSAISISYSVAGWGPVTLANEGQPGDTIELLSYSDSSFSLAANTPTIGKINTLSFDVNYTYPQGQFPINVSRPMTVSMVVGGIIQYGVFDSWLTYNPADSVWLNQGSTVTFDLGPSGTVDVTPLFAQITTPNIGHYETDVNATFVWHPVPDGGLTAALLGMSMLAVGWVRRMVK